MDIEKAIEILSNFDMQVTAKADGAYQSTMGEKACKYAVEALKELEQYRQIGTVERFAALDEQMKQHVIDETCCPKRNCNKCDKYRKELEKYRQIGTLDDCRVTRDELIELQEYRKLGTVKECWEAREKQIPKKVKFKTITIESYPSCPNCNEFYCDCSGGENYCKNCGQKWEWGD